MKSMTGYGRAEVTTGKWQLTVEMSAVNRKQTDIAIHLPSRLTELEPEVRKRILAAISRGRVNARVQIEATAAGAIELFFDEELARRYIDSVRRLAAETSTGLGLSASDLFRAPGVFRLEESEAELEELREPLMSALDQAIVAMSEMQEREGAHLREDIEGRLEAIGSLAADIRRSAPAVVENYRRNLRSRLQDSGLEIDLDDERVLREIGLYAERCDITEELIRIDSHLNQFRNYFGSGEAMGRPLDFLCQELNREINTIGSKANDAGIAQRIVQAKTELEKIREQVQNVQ